MINQIPPQNIEAEQMLLGAILLDNKILKKLEIEISDFYRSSHRLIFAEMLDLWQNKREIDSIVLTDALRTSGNLETIGGATYLATALTQNPTSSNWSEYALIVKEKANRRSAIALARNIEIEAFTGELEAIPELIRNHIKANRQKSGIIQAKQVAKSTLEYYDQVSGNPDHLIGVGTGLTYLDKALGGFQAGNLIYIGGRPGSGKTALALNITENMARKGEKAGIFSLEMQQTEIGIRYLSSIMSTNSKRIRLGYLQRDEYKGLLNATGTLAQFPHLFCFESKLTLNRFQAYAEEMVDAGAKLLIVDYLQLISHKLHGSNREQAVAEISVTAKQMAGSLGVPVILLAQLNRQCQIDRRYPSISDLRESGSTEADADVVLLLHNDRIYQVGKEEDPENKAWAIIAKGRNVSTGFIPLTFHAEYTRFENWEDEYETQGRDD